MHQNQQKQLALNFQKLHQDKALLILPNVWHAGGALVFEKQGYKAVATTSAGIAYALGYPDGEQLSLDELIKVVEQITKRISIPLSVDFERGYGETPEEVKANVKRVLEAGAVGINIEDGRSDGSLDDLQFSVDKIKAIAELKQEMDIPFVINARTCAFWLNVSSEDTNATIAVERAKAFKAAGADCIFIPGLIDETTSRYLVENIQAPVNLIANPLFNDIELMEDMGLSRLSVGSGAVRSVFNHLIDLGEDLRFGKMDQFFNHDFSYAKANAFFKS